MNAVALILTLLLAAEFVFAPINLWAGRTMPKYRRFTGLPDAFATRVLAPIKLITAVALLVGLGYHPARLAGGMAALAISCFYLVRLSYPLRRDMAGLAGFTIFGTMAAALVAITIAG